MHAFLRAGDLRTRTAEWAKALVRRALSRWDPFVRRTVARADQILSLGQEATAGLGEEGAQRATTMLACGTDPVAVPRERWERGSTFEVLFAGRLVDLKGCRLALEAFAHFAQGRPDARLRFAGRGPEEARLRAAADAAGVGEHVRFLGHLEHAEVLERMARADVFLFPSFEGGGMVVVEALARGCPVVCLDFGGPGEMVGEDRGIRVPLVPDFELATACLADALCLLYEDDDLRRSLGRGARTWAAEHAVWRVKGEHLEEIYTAAVGRRTVGEPTRQEEAA